MTDYKRDTAYWNTYYNGKEPHKEPSLFARYLWDHFSDQICSLIDAGCGNGRDSLFFADLGIRVLGVDASDQAIQHLQSSRKDNAEFICGDFIQVLSDCEKSDAVYSRFSIHAVDRSQQTVFLDKAYQALNENGLLFIESRSIHDEIYGQGECVGKDEYIFNGHYRRFLRLEELIKETAAAGFEILEASESRGYAPYGDADPLIIRCICRKIQ